MELKVLDYSLRGGIATLSLNRPQRLNAWTGRMNAEYLWALGQAEEDPSVRAIVVTGTGRGFCVGGDAEALQGHVKRGSYDAGLPQDSARPGYGVRSEFDAPFASQFGLSKPVAAAINGPAAGVGLALACFADLRFAAAGIRMSTAHGPLGLPAEFGLSWILPRLIGVGKAADLLLSSRKFSSEEALEMGLVNEVQPPDLLLERVYAYLEDLITRCSPGAVRAAKRQLYADLHRSAADSVEEAGTLLARMMKGDEYREGVDALINKRTPRWQKSAL